MALVESVPPGTPTWGSDWKKAVAHYYTRTLSLRSSGSCMSYRTNYLDLDPTYKDANGLPITSSARVRCVMPSKKSSEMLWRLIC